MATGAAMPVPKNSRESARTGPCCVASSFVSTKINVSPLWTNVIDTSRVLSVRQKTQGSQDKIHINDLYYSITFWQALHNPIRTPFMRISGGTRQKNESFIRKPGPCAACTASSPRVPALVRAVVAASLPHRFIFAAAKKRAVANQVEFMQSESAIRQTNMRAGRRRRLIPI